MLGLGFTSYAPHGHFWSSALYGNTLWYHKSQLLPESTFQGMSNSLWLWVGPRSWLANFLMVQGSQILCNNGRYESLTTSIAEVFVTRMSKRCLISWRWHKDWAVFQKRSGDVTTQDDVVCPLLSDDKVWFSPSWLSRRLEENVAVLSLAWCKHPSTLGLNEVLYPRVGDTDLWGLWCVAPVK